MRNFTNSASFFTDTLFCWLNYVLRVVTPPGRTCCRLTARVTGVAPNPPGAFGIRCPAHLKSISKISRASGHARRPKWSKIRDSPVRVDEHTYGSSDCYGLAVWQAPSSAPRLHFATSRSHLPG